MARIAGVDLPRDKRLDIALTYIYGVGTTNAGKIVAGAGVDAATKVRDLSEDEVLKIRGFIDQNLKVEGDLLTIRGERREEQKDKNHHEFHYGAFSRSIPLPSGVKAEDVTATYDNGVLEVRVPARTEQEPVARTIPVQRSGS